MSTDQTQTFESWWAGRFGEVLELTGDPDADATCRIAKIAAGEAWTRAMAQLRDILPVPAPGSPMEKYLPDAMATSDAIPAYVTAWVTALVQDSAQYQWLIDRLAGYDFNWNPSQVGANDGKHVAVFEVGPAFPCSRNISAAIAQQLAKVEAPK
ncbi:hypothetical protein K7G19_19690 [Cupriavidus sp. DB3]|uniref:hypothetical protein n=1 Tax=Cupriavidus sp. DB3 TaxID=2873259 RepID=UPI001CF2A376|nr:hypothetical protein [Cupriavidus sp. DB3]MCA7085815.1 hypothetical protein [Cupriavidus sp. DB3]